MPFADLAMMCPRRLHSHTLPTPPRTGPQKLAFLLSFLIFAIINLQCLPRYPASICQTCPVVTYPDACDQHVKPHSFLPRQRIRVQVVEEILRAVCQKEYQRAYGWERKLAKSGYSECPACHDFEFLEAWMEGTWWV